MPVSSQRKMSIQPIGIYPPSFPIMRQLTLCLFSIFRWIFEKYDGLRGFWNPEERAMYSRTGKKFSLSKEVLDEMPSDMFLDGELWYPLLSFHRCWLLKEENRFGRDNFQEALKLSYRVNPSELDWSNFKYMVFDAPKESGNYRDRYQALGKIYSLNS